MHDQTPESFDAIHTVLYIEDNAAHLGLIERVFARRPDLELISTTEGLLGLEVAREHQPAVVLLDIRLPDINGDEVLQRLRDDPLTSAIPVVIVSADAIDRHIQQRLEAGASAYLTKPVDTRLLMETVDELIHSLRRERAPAAEHRAVDDEAPTEGAGS